MGNTVGNKEAYPPKLNSREREILIGMVLGDAFVEESKTGLARVEVNHSLKQKEYLYWKFRELKRWVRANPYKIEYEDKRSGNFYRGKRKIIPKDIEKILTSPLSLAVWYMDDGKKRPDCCGAYLDTIWCKKEEQRRLIKCLKNNFGVETRMHWNGDGYHLYIPASSIERFRSLIEKYIIPSMRYKLPYTRNDFLPCGRGWRV
jgi:hypothetical protein